MSSTINSSVSHTKRKLDGVVSWNSISSDLNPQPPQCGWHQGGPCQTPTFLFLRVSWILQTAIRKSPILKELTGWSNTNEFNLNGHQWTVFDSNWDIVYLCINEAQNESLQRTLQNPQKDQESKRQLWTKHWSLVKRQDKLLIPVWRHQRI